MEGFEEGSPVDRESGNVVLCGASAYEEKYYFNPDFDKLPESIKEDLRIISVLFVSEIGGIFLMEFNGDGELMFRTEAKDSDYNYDDIGAGLMIKEIRSSREEFLRDLELFYRVFILKLPLEEDGDADR